jgi:hypothetical protein
MCMHVVVYIIESVLTLFTRSFTMLRTRNCSAASVLPKSDRRRNDIAGETPQFSRKNTVVSRLTIIIGSTKTIANWNYR